ncbi:MAG: sugar phosphate isomerase/epimerase [Rhodobacter sp.]|nr:sugar phosphate isomerase/epimerase [Rhodobacter sp.]
MIEYSYQLYSSRKFPPLGDTLKMLSDLGYTHVEGYQALFDTPASVSALADALAANGLTMPTAHFDLKALQNSPDRVLAIAATLGIKAIFVPYLAPPDRPNDPTGWTAFGKSLAQAGEPVRAAGLRFGWHNHDYEFAEIEGQFPLDLILAADKDLALELDLAWVVRGGQDPSVWMQKYADRLAAIHIKDIAPEGTAPDEDGWADLGHGTMDWAMLLRQARGTAAHYFVIEHDNPSDHRRFAERSLRAARSF